MSPVRPTRASVLLALCLSLPVVSQPAFAADRARPDRRGAPAPDPAPTVALDAAAEAARLTAIARLTDLLANAELLEQRSELLFRLAELTWEEARAVQLREMEGITGRIDQCYAAGGDCEALLAEAPTESRAWFERSLVLYGKLLEGYPDYARADEVTWAYARTLVEVGRDDEANVLLTRLVKTWPESRHVADAYVLVGEYWFERDEVYKALTAYQRAATYRTHEKSVFARYKVAWCHYNLGEPDVALGYLREVIEAPADPARMALRDEAIGDYVRFFAETGRTDLASDLARHVPPDVLLGLEESLAERWIAQGKAELAVAKWRSLGAANPEHPRAPRWADGVAGVYLRAGRLAEALGEAERMGARYGHESAWARANATRPQVSADADDRAEALLRTIATTAHAGAKGVPSQLPLAERAYALSLSRFPDGPHAYTLRYGYAELLYKLRRFEEAYAQYTAVVQADPDGEHARFCAESAIFAAHELARGEAAEVAGTDPVPLGAWERREIDAIDAFLRTYGGDRTLAMTYRAGWILYQKNHFREASERFRVVMAQAPRSREAEQAADLILDSLALVQDWEALAATAKVVAETPELGSDAFRASARAIYEKARFKQIEARFARDGDTIAAAGGALAYARELPSSPVADLALHNAAAWLDGRDLRGAIAAREALVAGYPTSKYRTAAYAALGFGYESLAAFDEAATWYERFAAADPAHPDAAAALWSAGLFRATLGQWQEAVADWQRYVSTWPDRPDAPGVTLQVGPLLAQNGRAADAAALYRAFFDAPPEGANVEQVMFARLAYGELLDDLGQGGRATRHWTESLAWLEAAEGADVSPTARGYGAKMRLALAEPAYQAFLAMRIAGPEGRALSPKQTDTLLERQLLDKVQAMRSIEATYTDVIETGAGEAGIAALARIGAAYENLGATLRASYVPDYLTEEQRWLYEQRLGDLAYAQEERAAAAYRATLEKAFDLNVYDEGTVAVARRLGGLRPEEARGLAEHAPAPRFLAAAGVGAGFEE